MPLSWNEIRDRALAFSREWADETSEDAEAKSFWDGFFSVFGVTRRRVASFEAPVKKGDGQGGFIDLLRKGVLLAEHKSRGKDLDRAARQLFPRPEGARSAALCAGFRLRPFLPLWERELLGLVEDNMSWPWD
jgi:hypothetical protein